MKFRASRWNRVVAPLASARLRAGEYARVARTGAGTILSADPAANPRWPHPWRVTAFWSAAKKRWLATVRAGFVNGEDPLLGAVPLLDLEPGEGLALPLIRWEEGRPPAFFAALGVRDPMEGLKVGDRGVSFVDTSWQDDFRPPARQLWRCDLQIAVARLGMAGETTIVEGLGTSGNVAVYSPALQSSLLSTRGPRAVLQAVPRFEPQRKPDLLEKLLGSWVDPQEDTLHLARVWLISPPGAGESDQPDGTWQALPQHFVFWNLAHAARVARIPPVLPPIRLITGLAAGVGDRINAALLAPINDDIQQISAAINTVTPEGRFWTV
jgi:hypothetical protein